MMRKGGRFAQLPHTAKSAPGWHCRAVSCCHTFSQRARVQIYSEIEERAAFVEAMQGTQGADDSVQAVRLQLAQRLGELRSLGEDVGGAR